MAKKHRGPGKGWVGGQYKPLTDKQVKQIHEASLAILARTGVQVEESEALRLFEEAGADVDDNRVRLSRTLVEDAVDKAPSRVLLAGRDPEDDLILEGARVHIGTGGVVDEVEYYIRSRCRDERAQVSSLRVDQDEVRQLIGCEPTHLPTERACTVAGCHLEDDLWGHDAHSLVEVVLGDVRHLHAHQHVEVVTGAPVSSQADIDSGVEQSR